MVESIETEQGEQRHKGELPPLPADESKKNIAEVGGGGAGGGGLPLRRGESAETHDTIDSAAGVTKLPGNTGAKPRREIKRHAGLEPEKVAGPLMGFNSRRGVVKALISKAMGDDDFSFVNHDGQPLNIRQKGVLLTFTESLRVGLNEKYALFSDILPCIT